MKQVIVFGGSFCSNCKTLIKSLENKNIPYVYKDVDDFEDEVTALGIRSLPHVQVMENDVEIFSGRGAMEANKVFSYFGD